MCCVDEEGLDEYASKRMPKVKNARGRNSNMSNDRFANARCRPPASTNDSSDDENKGGKIDKNLNNAGF